MLTDPVAQSVIENMPSCKTAALGLLPRWGPASMGEHRFALTKLSEELFRQAGAKNIVALRAAALAWRFAHLRGGCHRQR